MATVSIPALPEKWVLGLRIHNVTKTAFLQRVELLVKKKKHNYVVTPYSEFFVTAQKDPLFTTAINSADINIAMALGLL